MIHLELARTRPYENDSLMETRPTKGLKIVQSSSNFRDLSELLVIINSLLLIKGKFVL